ncbi:MAG: DUF1513 domain-containing protein [Myxococcales bacterium]|nr:DUF1513 domain-containing protein [Myxococcales bacterium]
MNSKKGGLNRRTLLKSTGTAWLLSACGESTAQKPLGLAHTESWWVGASGREPNAYAFSAIRGRDGYLLRVPSSFRGHAVAQHPVVASRVVMFARRPGAAFLEVDLRTESHQLFDVSPRFWLQGHGVFNGDGSHLLTVEAEAETGEGYIAVRDAHRDYEIIDRFPTHGIGPHEIKRLPSSSGHEGLVVANGGILTRPSSGRKPLNLDAMAPNLAYFDMESGECLEVVRLSESKASIRHLDVLADNRVVVGLQIQREGLTHNDTLPLVAFHERGTKPQLMQNALGAQAGLADYVGSVAVSHKHGVLGVTSPKGNLALFVDTATDNVRGHYAFHDVSGIALADDDSTFVLSSSVGQIRFVDAMTLIEDRSRRLVTEQVAWDNHLLQVEFI